MSINFCCDISTEAHRVVCVYIYIIMKLYMTLREQYSQSLASNEWSLTSLFERVWLNLC